MFYFIGERNLFCPLFIMSAFIKSRERWVKLDDLLDIITAIFFFQIKSKAEVAFSSCFLAVSKIVNFVIFNYCI